MIRITGVVIAIAAIGCRYGFDSRQIWSFDKPTDYVFVADQIAVDTTGAHLAAIPQTDADDSATGFGGGSADNIQWNTTSNLFELESPNLTGTYVSRVIDAGAAVAWNDLTWTPERPSGVPIPDDGSEVGVYALGNLDMTSAALVAHLDDLSTTTVIDSWGHHDGLNLNANVGNPGRFGTALGFQGTGDVDFGSDPALDPASPFSVSVWVKRELFNAFQYVGARDNASLQGWSISFDTSDVLHFAIGDGTAVHDISTSPIVYRDDTVWIHIVATQAYGRQNLYVDGVARASDTVPTNNAPTSTSFEIARRYDMDAPLTAYVDELALIGRELTADEVLELYYRGATRIQFQIRSCAQPDCSDGTFTGPGGGPGQWFTAPSSNTLPSVALTVAPNRYFQYQAAFASDTSEEPRLANVSIGPPHIYA